MLAHAQCITHESHKCLKWERFIIIYYSMMELHSKKVNNWNGTMYDILYELWSTKYAMNKFEMELIWADLMCMCLYCFQKKFLHLILFHVISPGFCAMVQCYVQNLICLLFIGWHAHEICEMNILQWLGVWFVSAVSKNGIVLCAMNG